MQLKKLLLLIVTTFTVVLLYESCRFPGGCGGTNTIYFRVSNPQITNNRMADTTNIYNIKAVLPIDTTKLTYQNFQWRVNFDHETYCKNEEKNNHFPSFFTAAYAKPAPLDYVCKENVATFVVTTENDYDDAHLAGSNINDILKITWLNPGEVYMGRIYNLVDFMQISDRLVEGDKFILYLRKPIKNNNILKAKIHIKLSDGQVFDINTMPINFYK